MFVVAPFQPTIFPPAYVFNRAWQADAVILMDSAQTTAFSPAEDGSKKKTGQKHLRIGGRGNVQDFAIPTTASMKPLNETPLDPSSKWRDTLIKSLQHRYGGSPFYKDITDIVVSCLYPSITLGGLNSVSFCTVLRSLEISTPVRMDSVATKATKGEWVINLVKSVGGDTLLTGKPSTAYMDFEHFAQNGVTITVQDWKQPEYQHIGEHEGQMSILHTLYSIGLEATSDLIRTK